MELHPRESEGSLQHALLLLARTEAHVLAVLKASALPPQRVTLKSSSLLILSAVCGAGTHLVFCDTGALGAPGIAYCP